MIELGNSKVRGRQIERVGDGRQDERNVHLHRKRNETAVWFSSSFAFSRPLSNDNFLFCHRTWIL